MGVLLAELVVQAVAVHQEQAQAQLAEQELLVKDITEEMVYLALLVVEVAQVQLVQMA
jgi:hypothetical protein